MARRPHIAMLAAALIGASCSAADEPAGTPIVQRADEIAHMLEMAPWVSAGNEGPVLYVVTFRTCTNCAAFKAAEYETLLADGADVRWIVYARRDLAERRASNGELAAVAQLAADRDYGFFTRWYAVAPETFYESEGLAATEPDGAALSNVEFLRQIADDMAAILRANGVAAGSPIFLWQQGEAWMARAGYSAASFARVRESLLAEG